jgi:hypothetical protein
LAVITEIDGQFLIDGRAVQIRQPAVRLHWPLPATTSDCASCDPHRRRGRRELLCGDTIRREIPHRYAGPKAASVVAPFAVLAILISADNLLWRLACWIGSFTFVAVSGDLRRELFRHLTGHAPIIF